MLKFTCNDFFVPAIRIKLHILHRITANFKFVVIIKNATMFCVLRLPPASHYTSIRYISYAKIEQSTIINSTIMFENSFVSFAPATMWIFFSF